MRFKPFLVLNPLLRAKCQVFRLLSTTRLIASGEPARNKSFSNTLLLPKTSFPLWSDPTKSEVPFRERTGDGLYRWQWETRKNRRVFVLHDGPPYANGDLHMGHALNKILKDIINRFHVLMGERVHYIPGWDCHGLPIENKALRELGKDASSVPATTIRVAARNTAQREIASQKEQFKQFGIMASWSLESTYRTLDHSYEMRQLRIFQAMVEKGLIYRHYRPVHYSPSSRSALAEAELIYKDDHVSHSAYVAFTLVATYSKSLRELLATESAVDLLVWTTTPWTLTANMGIAVNPEMSYSVLKRVGKGQSGILVVARERKEALGKVLGEVEEIVVIPGSELLEAEYIPLFASLSPGVSPANALKVIAASHVTAASGTGLVHLAPAHGAEDYATLGSLGLLSTAPMLCHVDSEGCFNSDVLDVVGSVSGPSLIGLEVLSDGGRKVVELLKDAGRVLGVERVKHRYPYDWKTDQPIIIMATEQWFANLDGIKSDALSALEEVSFFPPASRNRLTSFVQSRSEWCISRQRVWGVPIPALHHIPTGRVVLDSESLTHIFGVLQEKGVAYWWEGPVAEFLPPPIRGAEGEWRKGEDTMDVWFDSGSSWAMLREMGVGRTGVGDYQDGGGMRMFDADVCLEGSDQHRGWFQSQLLTAVGSRTQVGSPYGALITHGMVLDQQGKKMSKSLGNIISPMTIIHGGKDKKKDPAYGADVLRLWVATVEYGRDMSIGPTVLAQTAESMRKIRNSARFLLGNIGDVKMREDLGKVARMDLGLAERYIMNELYKLERVALDGYASYNFSKVINALTNFTNITLSSLYFDITKDCLYANGIKTFERRAVVTVLEKILKTMTRVLAPILPHLAEEIHQSLQGEAGDQSSVFQQPWVPLGSEWEDNQAEADMNHLLQVREVVLSTLEKARGDKKVKSSLEAEVDLVIPGDTAGGEYFPDLLRREEHFLKTLFIVSDAIITDEGSLGTTSPQWLYSASVSIPGCEEELGIRVRPATQSKCPRCWTFTRPESESLCSRCHAVVI